MRIYHEEHKGREDVDFAEEPSLWEYIGVGTPRIDCSESALSKTMGEPSGRERVNRRTHSLGSPWPAEFTQSLFSSILSSCPSWCISVYWLIGASTL